MRKRLALFVAAMGLTVAGLSAMNCDAVDAAFDCQSVCTRYRDCFQQDYNVDNCRSSCRNRAANDSTVKQAADTCESCIGDKSCVAAVVQCPSCAQIVP